MEHCSKNRLDIMVSKLIRIVVVIVVAHARKGLFAVRPLTPHTHTRVYNPPCTITPTTTTTSNTATTAAISPIAPTVSSTFTTPITPAA